jgi:Zn-dependent protease
MVFGGGSIQLARVFGIRIGVHVSWFLVLFLIIYTLTNYYERVGAGSDAFLLATVSALLFFLSILLHELGHAVVAIYERLRSRKGVRYFVDADKLMPLAYAGLMLILAIGLTAMFLDIVDPIEL